MPNGSENTNPSISPFTSVYEGKALPREEAIELAKLGYADLKAELEKRLFANLRPLAKQAVRINSPEELKEILLKYTSQSLPTTGDSEFYDAIQRVNTFGEEVIKENYEKAYLYLKSQEQLSLFLDSVKQRVSYFFDSFLNPNEHSIQNVAQGADPVNLYSGNFIYTTTDFAIEGGGINFVFSRIYSQLSVHNGVLGYKWSHNNNLWLRLSSDQNLIFRSNGAFIETLYRKQNVHNYWFADIGEDGVILERNNQFFWRSSDGIEYRYKNNLSGRVDILLIDRIEDRFGNYLQFVYENTLLKMVEVNNPLRIVHFTYDSQNRIIKITDFNNRIWRYYYDDMGDLVAVTTPATLEYKRGLTTGYEYSSYQFSSITQQHNLLRIIDASGQIYLENEYGTEPNLLRGCLKIFIKSWITESEFSLLSYSFCRPISEYWLTES